MEKLMLMRSLSRSILRRSQVFSSSSAAVATNQKLRHLHFSSPSVPASSPNQDFRHPFAKHLGGIRSFSYDISNFPAIEDPQIKRAFKDLMATNWDDLSPAVVHDVKKALSKSTEDKSAQDALRDVFRAAEAVEEFTGIIMSLKMELDDAIGLSGENVRPLPEDYQKAIKTLFSRYTEYLAAFEPKETYLKKKVETELGSKMIYLKMRCGGLEADWGKVTVLGTSGLSGSYVEQRA
ncbi:succinate dehydrogenase subunit 5, mitochondrial-like [Salvia splendens]|uniref:succinate dehydrogenase subunit 5, mitochondrial-like n=1 Tax=Salvia splendens TaxID=180675 RepID=UPI001C26F181|nr:succinate dehydrogenase subunit 5, mitochondrial-like [Salvia splendens]